MKGWEIGGWMMPTDSLPMLPQWLAWVANCFQGWTSSPRWEHNTWLIRVNYRKCTPSVVSIVCAYSEFSFKASPSSRAHFRDSLWQMCPKRENFKAFEVGRSWSHTKIEHDNLFCVCVCCVWLSTGCTTTTTVELRKMLPKYQSFGVRSLAKRCVVRDKSLYELFFCCSLLKYYF